MQLLWIEELVRSLENRSNDSEPSELMVRAENVLQDG